jgi:hypothetical protein
MSPFAREIAELSRFILKEYRDRLTAVGLRVEFRGLFSATRTAGIPDVELGIDFYRSNDLVDAFEFFVERRGEPAAAVSEIEEWLRRELDLLVDPGRTDN